MNKFKCLILFLVFMIVCAVALCSCGDASGGGRVVYELSTDKSYYIVTGTKDEDATSIVVDSTYRNLPVKNIKSEAFLNCVSLKKIVIPESVTTIGKGAFAGCTSLECITLPFAAGKNKGETYFRYMFSSAQYSGDSDVPVTLKKVTITAGDKITKSSFSGCENITEISIPSTITSIEENAFGYCSALKTINIPESLSYIGRDAFLGCVSLDKVLVNDLSSWCRLSFYNSDANPLKYGKLYLNGSDNYVTKLQIPDDVTKINSYAFYNCDYISGVIVPESVTYIGRGAFCKCNSIKSIVLPFVGFQKNDSQGSLFGSIFGEELLFGVSTSVYDNDYVPQSLKSVTITQGNLIRDYVFLSCKSIKKIELPNGLTTIGEGAFAECSSLSQIDIPSGVGIPNLHPLKNNGVF